MKKLGLIVMPLMAISLLASCGGAKKKSYKVSVAEHDHLLFTTIKGKPLDKTTAIAGEPFTFNMKVDESANDAIYKLPGTVYIYIGNSDVELADGFHIETIVKDVEARVTIDANKIAGNIKIKANAVKIDYYQIDIMTYGVNHSVDIKNPYALTNEEKNIIFTQIETYDLPTDENIYLNFDNTGWKKPSEASTYCTYDEITHELTIKPNAVNSSVKIRARSIDYQLLDDLSWQEISQYSAAGWAPYVFYLGEIKKLQLKHQDENKNGKIDNNEVYQTARIIGFNHDVLADGTSKVGITFEFVDLISDANGYSLATPWDWMSGLDSTNFYFDSNLKKVCDGKGKGTISWYEINSATKSTTYKEPVIDMLPTSLRKEIKKVKKLVSVGGDAAFNVQPFVTELFPLSMTEMSDGPFPVPVPQYVEEGDTYDFYKTSPDPVSVRIKHQIKWHDGAATKETEVIDYDHTQEWDRMIPKNFAGYNANNDDTWGGWYWTRSPFCIFLDSANSICENGKRGNPEYEGGAAIWVYLLAVAPAFCI